MQALKDKIVKDGRWVGEGILKVDSFLNHQVDITLMDQIGEYIAQIYQGEQIDRVLTAETSGIAIACSVSRALGGVPMVFAKKNKPITMTDEFYQSMALSFTKGTSNSFCVSKMYLHEGEKVLIVDDFLARGESGSALCEIVKSAGAEIVGYTAVIEKLDQHGADKIRERYGCKVQSLAIIKQVQNGVIDFVD